MKTLLLIVSIALFSNISFAAPLPGSSTGRVVAPKLGIFKSRHGFEIAATTTKWLQVKPPKKSKYIETVYRSPKTINNTRATLTVRVDKLKKKSNLQKYVKRWVKEYPKYGYDVLGSKKFKTNGRSGYVIDLLNSKRKRQLRQVIYLKKKTAVLMTCRDHMKNFKSSLRECNKIVKNFAWKRS